MSDRDGTGGFLIHKSIFRGRASRLAARLRLTSAGWPLGPPRRRSRDDQSHRPDVRFARRLLRGPRSSTDPHDMAAWLEGPEGPGLFRVTRWVIDAMAWRERHGYACGERSVNSQIVEETFAAAGAYVMGRRMFDGGEIPWGEVPPFRAAVSW